jgi:hypothetical protein
VTREQYHRYLASREWALKKEAVKRRAKGACERCWKNPHEQTHHLTYIRVGRELLEDLLGVCRPCHEYLSGKSNFDPTASPYRTEAEESEREMALERYHKSAEYRFRLLLDIYNSHPGTPQSNPQKLQLKRELEAQYPQAMHSCNSDCERYGCENC